MTLSSGDLAELTRIARAAQREFVRTGHPLPGRPHKATLLAPGIITVRLLRGDAVLAVATAGDATTPRYLAAQHAAIAALIAAELTAIDDVTVIVDA